MIYVLRGILKFFLIVAFLVTSLVLIFKILQINHQFKLENVIDLPYKEPDNKKSSLHATFSSRGKCDLPHPCPEEHFTFTINTGAANVIGPKLCFDGEWILGGKNKPGGPGINIVIVNGQTGEVISTDYFDMWNADVEPLVEFLKSIKNGSLVLMVSSDDPATKLNDEARTLITQLGSSYISTLGFRDNWIFVAGKGIKTIKPLEKHIKNDKEVNKYDDWPEMLQMEGCVPRQKG
ncbi:protein FAM3C isoform X2 [Hoplias malabaricus]|uniref:protein FAM3C isoform X2 n=1 Tax=Hoplias malabaricus TaxID=27720 RepID=UPI0034622D12